MHKVCVLKKKKLNISLLNGAADIHTEGATAWWRFIVAAGDAPHCG